jgi:hypothetical protein
MSWVVVDVPPEMHVIPLADSQPHFESTDCPCRPTRDEFDVIVHNSFDGREVAERRTQ